MIRRTRVILILFLVFLCFMSAASAGDWQSFHIDAGEGKNDPALDYWVYVPSGETEGLPLVLFLHGSGERGSDALNQSLPLYIRDGRIPEPDALLVIPQLPNSMGYWHAAENTLLRITDEVTSAFGADPSALSLSGFSLGGMGTWNLSKIAPGRFSRVLCVCGRISTWVPVEFFTGTALRLCTGKHDNSFDPKEERNYAESARKAGVDAEWIEYPSNHLQTSVLVFTDMEMLTWLRLYKEDETLKEEAP